MHDSWRCCNSAAHRIQAAWRLMRFGCIPALCARSGISLKTQFLYALVFVCRYLDLFWNFASMYNWVMKVRPHALRTTCSHLSAWLSADWLNFCPLNVCCVDCVHRVFLRDRVLDALQGTVLPQLPEGEGHVHAVVPHRALRRAGAAHQRGLLGASPHTETEVWEGRSRQPASRASFSAAPSAVFADPVCLPLYCSLACLLMCVPSHSLRCLRSPASITCTRTSTTSRRSVPAHGWWHEQRCFLWLCL